MTRRLVYTDDQEDVMEKRAVVNNEKEKQAHQKLAKRVSDKTNPGGMKQPLKKPLKKPMKKD